VWEKLKESKDEFFSKDEAIQELIQMHELDYERLWANFNKTDKKLLLGLSASGLSPLSEAFIKKNEIKTASTVFSSLKKLSTEGYITKNGSTYEIDDPFFARWLLQCREA
jgi:hypothetical protein